MGDGYNWSNLPNQLVISIVERLNFANDYVRLTAVSKSWKSAVEEVEKPCLSPQFPMLLLAEEVAPGGIIVDASFDDNDIDDDNDRYDGDNEDDDDDDDDVVQSRYLWDLMRGYDHRNNSIGSRRNLYSLATGKTYTIELPEAAGKLILGTNKGWLVTLGRDLQINLLHPLFRHQILLPPMLTFAHQYHPTEVFCDMFIQKVFLSSRVTTTDTNISLPDEYYDTSPIVMAVYGEGGFLAFARLGDKVWTDVNIPSPGIHDITCHKGKFYAVNGEGDVFVCYTDNDKKGGFKGAEIASVPEVIDGNVHQSYLVETQSGSDLLLVVRAYRVRYYKPPHRMRIKYRTINFGVWKLKLNYRGSRVMPPCFLTKINNLGNETIFVGRNSSVSVSSSEIIKANCIYFTDDNEIYSHRGGGHDMGIFNMQSRTIEPHFQGKSLHPISPPLWYI